MIYFVIGVLQDICGAMWAYDVAHKNYTGALWAGAWAFMHVCFVVAVKSGDWYNTALYCAGVASGTFLVIAFKKRFDKRRRDEHEVTTPRI